MCILFLAVNRHPRYSLIIAANRDEFYARPSSAMHYWPRQYPGQPQILAGQDDLKGGTWLGVTETGKFCAVTNFRTGNPDSPDALSRGELVTRYLADSGGESGFSDYLADNGHRYSPFNLVFGNAEGLNVFCNQNHSLVPLQDGFHSLSNGYMDQQWPKMSLGVQKLTAVVEQHSEIDIDELNEIMHDQTRPEDQELPSTGVSMEEESLISSIFISGNEYGTRTTTYALFSKTDIALTELNYDRDGSIVQQQSFIVDIEHG